MAYTQLDVAKSPDYKRDGMTPSMQLTETDIAKQWYRYLLSSFKNS
jgi:hypothetical protein